MTSLLVPTLLVAAGVAVLTVGADLLVRGAAGLAARLGMTPLVIGLTVVALGTSLPETAVSIGSAVLGRGEVALGNAVGSNIFNILVVLGGAALIRPLVVNRQLVRIDLPVMVVTALLVVVVTLDGRLGSVDGAVLLSLGALYIGWLVWMSRRYSAANAHEDATVEVPPSDDAPVPMQLLLVAGGAVLLVVGARLLVGGASDIARSLGASELVIGLTVVAAGTSLPEVATSFTAAIRGQRDIAVGNVVGSNVFNVLIVLGAAGAVAPEAIPVPRGLITFDLPIMVGVSLACLPIFFTGWAISRWEGLLFLGYYVAYLIYLVLHQADHAADDVVRDSILFFAAPLTAVTLIMVAGQQFWRSRKDE